MPDLDVLVDLCMNAHPAEVGHNPGLPLAAARHIQRKHLSLVPDVLADATRPPVPTKGARGWLAGKQWQGREVAEIWLEQAEIVVAEGYLGPALSRKVFHPLTVAEGVGTCSSESQRMDGAVNENYVNGVLVSTDRGPWQENDKAHPHISDADAFDMHRSTYWAIKIWADWGGSFNPWYGYKDGIYLYDAYRRVAVCAVGGNMVGLILHDRAVANGYKTVYKRQLIDARGVRIDDPRDLQVVWAKPTQKLGYVYNR